jgi:predicted TIM-barrel fold metal-dependent hydrolase
VGAGRKIIDAHFHLWNLDENYYPWLSGSGRGSLVKDIESLRANYLVSDLLKDFGDLNVVAGVHIQAEHDHADPVRETRWLQKVADEAASAGFPNAIIADADFAKDDVEAVLEGHCAFRNMRGVRHVLHRTLNAAVPYDPLKNPAWHRNFPLLKKFGLSFDMQLFWQQADDAVMLIRDNPDVQIVLDHAAMPIWNDAENMVQWRRALRRYAEFPNVAIKISGFGTPYPDWNARSIGPIVSEIMTAFTPQRSMLASNFPVERLAKSYADVWGNYAEYFSAYSDEEQDLLFWRNASRIYRINLRDIDNA